MSRPTGTTVLLRVAVALESLDRKVDKLTVEVAVQSLALVAISRSLESLKPQVSLKDSFSHFAAPDDDVPPAA